MAVDGSSKKDLEQDGNLAAAIDIVDPESGEAELASPAPASNTLDARAVSRKLSRKNKSVPGGDPLPLKERLRHALPYLFKLALVVPCVLMYILLGALIFSLIENRSYTMSVYWAVVTAGTVGYGDVVPKTDGGKIYFAFYTVLALTLLMWLFSYIGSTIHELKATLRKKGHVIAIPTYMDVIGSLCITISWLLVLILIGAFGMGALTAEVQEPIDYFYFTMATLTTVGYGDYSGDNTKSRVFLIFFILIGVTIFTARLGQLLATFSAMDTANKFENCIKSGVTKELVETFDTDMSGDVDENEFVLGFLLYLSQVNLDDVQRIRARFTDIDLADKGLRITNDMTFVRNNIVQASLQKTEERIRRVQLLLFSQLDKTGDGRLNVEDAERHKEEMEEAAAAGEPVAEDEGAGWVHEEPESGVEGVKEATEVSVDQGTGENATKT